MGFQIREAITENVAGQSGTEFTDIIEDAIERGDEHLLPGLGVFLEKWWHSVGADEQQNFSKTLESAFANSTK